MEIKSVWDDDYGDESGEMKPTNSIDISSELTHLHKYTQHSVCAEAVAAFIGEWNETHRTGQVLRLC